MPRGPDIHFKKKTAQRRADLKRSYGITLEQFTVMFRAQNGRCVICHRRLKTDQDQAADAAHVDHDHHTGKVRAILCPACNHGLGCFYDSPDFLRKAAIYLEHHQK